MIMVASAPLTGKSLSQWQCCVLRWIADGCPENVMEGFTYKTTAVALQNRHLAKVSRRGGLWKAEITEAGMHYLTHGIYPPPQSPTGTKREATPTKAPRTRRGGTQAPRPLPNVEPAPAAKPARPTARRGPTEELVDAVQTAGGVLRVQRQHWPAKQTDWHYEQLVSAAHRFGKVPAGKRLVTKHLTWPDMEIQLVDEHVIPGTDVPLRAVAVPSKINRYHAAAVRFRENDHHHEVSKPLLSRAIRIVHALATEADNRGYVVANAERPRGAYGYDGWSGSRDSHLVITVNGHSQRLRIMEERRFATNPPGHLKIEVDGGYNRDDRPAQWADRKSWSLEDKLPEILREVEIRAAEAEHRAREAERAAADKQRRWEAAMARAKAQLWTAPAILEARSLGCLS
jgi:hypothetical protein